MKVVVTGGAGFIGRALVARLLREDCVSGVTAVVRRESSSLPADAVQCAVGDIAAGVSWADVLRGADAIVHCAARVHVMKDHVADPLAAYRAVNLNATLELAQAAAQCGVKRFVFLSSIKVNGEMTKPGQAFSADDDPAPIDPYGVSKAEAEKALFELSVKTGMEVVVIRPPLVYGKGVKANFEAMLRWTRKGIPLPLGAIRNARSLVSIENLTDLIVLCLHHPCAGGQVFMVSDGIDVSTSELLRRVARAMGRPARIFPVPESMLSFAARLIGRPDIAQRLCSSLRVDIGKTQQLLGWRPVLSLDEGLRNAAKDFTT
jgi:UDP-glucose 4-epimerase